MEKDIITIKLEDGTLKDMEIILLYSDDNTKNNYILYKDIDATDECYAAKYTQKGDIFDIDSNLTKKELKVLEIILEKALKENVNEN